MPNLYPFLIYVIVTTFTPGPNNIMAMTNAMHDGFTKTIRFVFGIFAGFIVILLLSGLLNLVLADILPEVHLWLNILGAGYMVFLAIHIIRSKPIADDPSGNKFNSFKAGFVMQFLNIKVIVYGITVFSLFIIERYHDLFTISLFAFVLAFIGFVATTTWALGGNLFRPLLKKHYRFFNIVMGALLIYTAIASLW
jgi:threonine/homoserine/homoserine lactone efflux protein